MALTEEKKVNYVESPDPFAFFDPVPLAVNHAENADDPFGLFDPVSPAPVTTKHNEFVPPTLSAPASAPPDELLLSSEEIPWATATPVVPSEEKDPAKIAPEGKDVSSSLSASKATGAAALRESLQWTGAALSQGAKKATPILTKSAKTTGGFLARTYDNLSRPPPPRQDREKSVVVKTVKTTIKTVDKEGGNDRGDGGGTTVIEQETTMTIPNQRRRAPAKSVAERGGNIMGGYGISKAAFSLLKGDTKGIVQGVAVAGVGMSMAGNARQKRYDAHSTETHS